MIFKFALYQRVVVGKHNKIGTIIDYMPFRNKKGQITQMRYLVEYKDKPKADRPKQVYENQISLLY